MENLKEYLIKLGIYDSEKTERFKFFINILKEWNSFMNLTAIKDDEGIEIKHIIDSLTLLETDCISKDKKVLDVGSGAGFPSVPIKISIPELKMDLLDSLNKRVIFLKEVSKKMDFDNFNCIHGRAEELAHEVEYREKYDIVVARAVAELRILLEYCMPFVKPGGYFIAMKGPKLSEELQNSQKALDILKGEVYKGFSFVLPKILEKREVIIFKKKGTISEKYPRNHGKIKKNPL